MFIGWLITVVIPENLMATLVCSKLIISIYKLSKVLGKGLGGRILLVGSQVHCTCSSQRFGTSVHVLLHTQIFLLMNTMDVYLQSEVYPVMTAYVSTIAISFQH